MNCENMELVGIQNAKTQWGITLEIEKIKKCSNNCCNCPNKELTAVTKKVSQVNK
ncbi:MAG: hypothetical protein ACJA0I_000308 [Gammaproteobacteria bacterium]|jgi:hypothetical protein